MALSRIALAASAALLAAPACAQPDPVALQQDIVRTAVADDCGGTSEEEIVVCGRRREEEQARRYRVPPTSPYSGPAESAGGEQRYAMAANDQRCTPVGRAQQCSGGLDVLAIAFGAVRIVRALRARRD
jgi:hypothetical protein